MVNCTARTGSIDANPDIVGPGVLVAFFVTAVITIIAVLFAYLTGSLDGDFLTDLDYYVIAKAKRLGNALRGRPPLPSDDRNLTRRSEKPNEARKEAILQFILALSDQQLVTGLAILICGVANMSSLSVYEFSVVLSLAWFSSTTHLATLDALRTYLKTHGVIRHIRVAAIVCVLVLLCYVFAMTIAAAATDTTIPIQCVADSTGHLVPLEPLSLLSAIMVFALVVSGYVIRVIEVYGERGLWPLLWRMIKILRSDSKPLPVEFDQVLIESRASSHARELRLLEKNRKRNHYFFTGHAAFMSYDRSFLSSLPNLAFSFTYGVSQVVGYRFQNSRPLTPESNEMGFGQLMAVFLLVLPFLSAGETYYDYAVKRPSPTEGHHAGRSAEPVNHDSSSQRHSTDDQEARSISDPGYEGQVDEIRKILPRKVRLISELQNWIESGSATSGSATSRAMILAGWKNNAMEEYKFLKTIESRIDHRSGLSVFFPNLMISILLGALLNNGMGDAQVNFSIFVATVMLFVVYTVGTFYKLVLQILWEIIVVYQQLEKNRSQGMDVDVSIALDNL